MKQLITEMVTLSDEGRHKARPYLYAIFFIAVGVLFIGVIAFFARMNQTLDEVNNLAASVRDTQKSNTKINKSTADLVERVDSCVNPDGKCAQDSRKQTAKFLGNVGEISRLSSTFAVYCGSVPANVGDLAKVNACVEDRMTAAGYPPTPRKATR